MALGLWRLGDLLWPSSVVPPPDELSVGLPIQGYEYDFGEPRVGHTLAGDYVYGERRDTGMLQWLLDAQIMYGDAAGVYSGFGGLTGLGLPDTMRFPPEEVGEVVVLFDANLEVDVGKAWRTGVPHTRGQLTTDGQSLVNQGHVIGRTVKGRKVLYSCAAQNIRPRPLLMGGQFVRRTSVADDLRLDCPTCMIAREVERGPHRGDGPPLRNTTPQPTTRGPRWV